MRKATLVIVILSLLFTTSCKKNGTNLPQSSWIFKGVAYAGDTCRIYGGMLVAKVSGSGYGNNPPQQVQAIFVNSPTTSGIYTVINSNQLGTSSLTNQMAMAVISGTNYYTSTGGGTSSQTVQVFVSSTGKITVSGDSIELKNTAVPYDSTTLNFNIIETQ